MNTNIIVLPSLEPKPTKLQSIKAFLHRITNTFTNPFQGMIDNTKRSDFF